MTKSECTAKATDIVLVHVSKVCIKDQDTGRIKMTLAGVRMRNRIAQELRSAYLAGWSAGREK